MNPEIKTTVDICNGKITKATGLLSVKYAEKTLNKRWLSCDDEVAWLKRLAESLEWSRAQDVYINIEKRIKLLEGKKNENCKD